jgi:acetyltransferase-like isoleucine patch superfamily enzyme
MTYLLHHSAFVIRFRYWNKFISTYKRFWYSLLGMQIGSGTNIPTLHVTWPNQVYIGNNCTLEHNIFFKYDGIWKSDISIQISNKVFIGSGCEFNIKAGIKIGDNCLIASGCRFIDHDHGVKLGQLMFSQHGPEKPIKLGEDVWLGCNVVVLKGVEIANGAVVAAGSIVTKSIPANEIWAGVPARKIGQRT